MSIIFVFNVLESQQPSLNPEMNKKDCDEKINEINMAPPYF